MTVLTPWVLWAAAAGVIALIAAHLLSVKVPRAITLPTTRFVPPTSARAISRSTTPTDRLLLLLRAVALFAASAAFAGVQCAPVRTAVGTMVVLDLARTTETADAWRGSVRAVATRYPDVRMVVMGNSEVRFSDSREAATWADTARLTMPTQDVGISSLAGTLLRARRAATELADQSDSVRLVLVSPLVTDETVDAIRAVRGSWPGSIVVERLATNDALGTPKIAPEANTVEIVGGDENDEVGEALVRLTLEHASPVRVVRSAPSAADSVFAQNGGVVVLWPARDDSGSETRSEVVRGAAASVQAIAARGHALIASFQALDSSLTTGTPIIWWSDGEAAAVEAALGSGCMRRVGFAPPGGDLLLTTSARALLRALVGLCGTAASPLRVPLDSTLVAFLAAGSREGTAERADSGLASAERLASPLKAVRTPLAPWLLGVALLALLSETVLRRSSTAARASA